MSEKVDDSIPYRYMRTFKQEEATRSVSDMDKDELQAYISKVLGAKGLETEITENSSN